MRASISIHVTGTVQGVFYRQSTQRKADELGIKGFVQNEPDGSVTAHAEGDAAAVDALVEWCRRGPDAARVTAVETSAAPFGDYAFFDIRR